MNYDMEEEAVVFSWSVEKDKGLLKLWYRANLSYFTSSQVNHLYVEKENQNVV